MYDDSLASFGLIEQHPCLSVCPSVITYSSKTQYDTVRM